MAFNELVKKHKWLRGALLIFSIAFCIFSIHGFVDLVRQMDTREIMREFGAAADQLQKSPPGIERADVFLKRIKTIDTGHAPAEVKQALQDYISVMEQGVDAIKAGRDSSQYDAKMAEARQRFIRLSEKWDNCSTFW